MKKIFIALFAIMILFVSIGNATSFINPEFKEIMVKYGYSDKVYKTKIKIEKEMKNYNTNIKAFQVQIGKSPDGFLTKDVFEKWQKWKKFKKESWYMDNHPYVATDQGNIRLIYKPINIKKDQKQFIFELESYNNEIIIAFNLKEYPQFAKFGIVVCGYGKSKKLFNKCLIPIKGMKGYYMIKVSLPYNKIFYFKIVKFGNDYETFSGNLPFEIYYSDLARKKLIDSKIGEKFKNEKCQAIIRSGNGIEFLHIRRKR